MFKTFFASAMLVAATSPLTLQDQDHDLFSFEDHSAFLPILAAQTDALSETDAFAEAEGVNFYVDKMVNRDPDARRV